MEGRSVPIGARNGYSLTAFNSGVVEAMRKVEAQEREAGRPFRPFRAHDLRHGFAIRALQRGMGIYGLSRHLGHTSVKTTEIHLRHLTTERAEAALREGGTNSGTVV